MTTDESGYYHIQISSTATEGVCRVCGSMGEGVISRLLDKYIEAEVNCHDSESLDQLGIDAIALKKGHKDFVTLVTSRIHENIQRLSVLKDRKKATLKG